MIRETLHEEWAAQSSNNITRRYQLFPYHHGCLERKEIKNLTEDTTSPEY